MISLFLAHVGNQGRRKFLKERIFLKHNEKQCYFTGTYCYWVVGVAKRVFLFDFRDAGEQQSVFDDFDLPTSGRSPAEGGERVVKPLTLIKRRAAAVGIT